MSRVFSIKWREDGTPVASKGAPKGVTDLIKAGYLKQKPIRRRALKGKDLREAGWTKKENNPYGVMPGQIWKDVDTHTDAARLLLVMSLCWSEGGYFALVENKVNLRRSFINLKRFTVRGKRGFKKLH